MRLTVAAQAGALVRQHRNAAKISTDELAKRAGWIEGSRIRKLEISGQGATLDNLAAIARALNVPLRELVP